MTTTTTDDDRRAYVEAIMNRLQRQYAEQTPLPLRGPARVRPVVLERPGVLTLPMLQRLYRKVLSEGYGG